jgi:hypothetical protein
VWRAKQHALDSERPHSRRLQAHVETAEAATRSDVVAAPRLTAEERPQYREHESAVDRDHPELSDGKVCSRI